MSSLLHLVILFFLAVSLAFAGDKSRYYSQLGLNEGASEAEIKTAFRKLAMRYHPDRGEGADEAVFKRVVEAYKELIDAQKDHDSTSGHGFEEWTQASPIPSFADLSLSDVLYRNANYIRFYQSCFAAMRLDILQYGNSLAFQQTSGLLKFTMRVLLFPPPEFFTHPALIRSQAMRNVQLFRMRQVIMQMTFDENGKSAKDALLAYDLIEVLSHIEKRAQRRPYLTLARLKPILKLVPDAKLGLIIRAGLGQGLAASLREAVTLDIQARPLAWRNTLLQLDRTMDSESKRQIQEALGISSANTNLNPLQMMRENIGLAFKRGCEMVLKGGL